MKTRVLIIVCAWIIFSAGMLSEDGRAGYTGSPGERTCVSCHEDFVLNSGTGFIRPGSNMINWTYEPGVTYNMSITVGQSGTGLFGFGVEILDSINQNAGTLIITDPVRTQIKNRYVNGVFRRNVVHMLGGGAFSDSSVFTFDWTAPLTDIGTVTMYFSGVAANASGTDNGDYVYNSSQQILPAINTSVPEIYEEPFVSVRENYITINTTHEIERLALYDLRGRQISDQTLHSRNIELPSYGLAAGIYLLRLESGAFNFTKKIIIDP